jgi:hypothetical protein
MSEIEKQHPSDSDPLFDRVVSILDQARGNVVRAVNSNMVMAYWLIGREIVEELQGGEERAEYGKQVLGNLSKQLTNRYGKGFLKRNLHFFKQFYLVYMQRNTIVNPVGSQSKKLHPLGGESEEGQIQYPASTKLPESSIPSPPGSELEKQRPPGAELEKGSPAEDEWVQGFSPQLSWSHYRVLMRVENTDARDFYEGEAIEGGWSKRTLERQVHTQYYERSLHAQQPDKMIAEGRKIQKTPTAPDEILKNLYVLEFLGYPNFADVRMFDGLFTAPDDNPTIGLILCTEKCDTVARYSVLNDPKQIYASKYLPNLPTEEQLQREIERERRLIEAALEERKQIGGGE